MTSVAAGAHDQRLLTTHRSFIAIESLTFEGVGLLCFLLGFNLFGSSALESPA